MNKINSRELYLLFGQLLNYPTPDLVQQASECAAILSTTCRKAGELIAGFRDQAEQIPIKKLCEIYTYTFDLQGNCPPYIGHQLFGESYKRNWFMSRLNKQYQEMDFIVEKELPDHVVVILNFLADHNTDEFAQVLEREGLKPAVDKMLELFGEGDVNPYLNVLKALSLVLPEPNMMTPGNGTGCE